MPFIMSIECWKFINSFAPWFSAIGTISAVVVSLYIALSSRKISINISSDIFDFGNENRSLIITVTNTGLRTVVVDNQHCIRFQAGRFKNKKVIGVGTDYIDYQKTTAFPWRITEGETAKLVINMNNEDGNWLINLKHNLLKEMRLSTLKVMVLPNASKPHLEKVGSTIHSQLQGPFKANK